MMVEIVFVFFLVRNFLLALAFGNASIKKGYSGIVTGLITLFFGIPGILYAIAIPDRVTNDDENRFNKLIVILVAACAIQSIGTAALFNVVLDKVSDAIIEARDNSQITQDSIDSLGTIINMITY